jgi:tetratricopeptide (TPR) repeat protein
LIPGISDNVSIAEPLFQEGLGHLKAKEYYEAVKCFDKAVEIEKRMEKKPIYLYNKGLALCGLERNNEAMECYRKAIELNPNLADAWKDVGLVLKDSGRYKEAVKCFDKAKEIDPNLADAWLAKGLVLTQLEKDYEAIEQFNKAIELDPESVNAWNQKGKALYRLGRYKEAIECLDTVLKKKEYEDTYFFRGQSKCALEDYTSALEDFNKVSDQYPFHDEKTTSIGHCYYELGFHEDAENHYREAIKSNPKLVRAYFHLAILYANENKYDRAK